MNSAAWLVDVGYVVKASEGIFRLDYLRALRHLESKCGPTRAFLFNGYDEAYGIPAGLRAFYDAMRAQGMEVRLQPMQAADAGAHRCTGEPESNRQRRVDVDLAAHLVWQASLATVETLVVTSGDQDLIPAIKVAREQMRVRVILFTYRRNVSHELVELADAWWLFEDEAERLARG
jgi:uncharacterized LabA/DUF88 family protein